MANQSNIQNYGMDVKDLDTSAFEMIEMLHLRSKIHQYFHELSVDDKNKVTRYNLILFSNAQPYFKVTFVRIDHLLRQFGWVFN